MSGKLKEDMANKNAKRRKQAIARAAKESFRGNTSGVAVISQNLQRRTQLVVCRETGVGGKMISTTRHEPIGRTENYQPKQKQYLEKAYKEKIAPNGTSKPAHEQPAEGFAFDNSIVHV